MYFCVELLKSDMKTNNRHHWEKKVNKQQSCSKSTVEWKHKRRYTAVFNIMAAWYPAAEINHTSNTCTTALTYKSKEQISSAHDLFSYTSDINSVQMKEKW